MYEEILDIVDNNGSIMHQASKVESHKHGWLHKTVIGYIRDANSWTLVRQSDDKQDAGQFVAPVGGHVKSNETEIEALLRESEEEIGTRNIEYKYIGVATYHRQIIGRDENHMCFVYEINTLDHIKLGVESVSVETFSNEDLKRQIIENPDDFGDGYYFILERFYPEYLPKKRRSSRS
jgi:8-oxo-dGTP pyrophosphatase MutT (NUDIX family)